MSLISDITLDWAKDFCYLTASAVKACIEKREDGDPDLFSTALCSAVRDSDEGVETCRLLEGLGLLQVRLNSTSTRTVSRTFSRTFSGTSTRLDFDKSSFKAHFEYADCTDDCIKRKMRKRLETCAYVWSLESKLWGTFDGFLQFAGTSCGDLPMKPVLFYEDDKETKTLHLLNSDHFFGPELDRFVDTLNFCVDLYDAVFMSAGEDPMNLYQNYTMPKGLIREFAT